MHFIAFFCEAIGPMSACHCWNGKHMKVTVCWGDGSGISLLKFSCVHFFVIHFWREAEVSLISGKYGGGKKQGYMLISLASGKDLNVSSNIY